MLQLSVLPSCVKVYKNTALLFKTARAHHQNFSSTMVIHVTSNTHEQTPKTQQEVHNVSIESWLFAIAKDATKVFIGKLPTVGWV